MLNNAVGLYGSPIPFIVDYLVIAGGGSGGGNSTANGAAGGGVADVD